VVCHYYADAAWSGNELQRAILLRLDEIAILLGAAARLGDLPGLPFEPLDEEWLNDPIALAGLEAEHIEEMKARMEEDD
jgi:hypothetical protein